MKKLLRHLFRIISIIFPYEFRTRLVAYKNTLYTMWIGNFVGHLGENSIIRRPCCLQGEGQKNITIGNNTIINANSVLGCWVKCGDQSFSNASISIGDNCCIGEYNHITAIYKITIGNGLLTGRFVIISDNSHGGLSEEDALIEPVKRRLISKGEVVIGDNVWLGDKVAVLSGVKIGNNVIVAANAVVTKDIPDNCMVAGVPAKIIKRINPAC